MARLFIGIPMSANFARQAVDWQSDHVDWPVRWTGPSMLHVTVVPPWEEHQDSTAEIAQKLQTIRIPQFELSFTRIAFGPSSRNPRMIWATGPTPPSLENLQRNLYAVLGFNALSRLLRLHITLARFHLKIIQYCRLKNFNQGISWPESVDSFSLIQSRLLPQGTRHTVVERFRNGA